MRADAQKNHDHLLSVGRQVVMELGADASLREIARRAGVGLGTLYRHFPRREVLLEALLRTTFNQLTARAAELEASQSPGEALILWAMETVGITRDYSGAIDLMVAAIAEPESALHASCVTMKAAGTRLLIRAQEAGEVRGDLNGTDLFALISALAWLHDQPPFAARADHLSRVVAGALLGRSDPA